MTFDDDDIGAAGDAIDVEGWNSTTLVHTAVQVHHIHTHRTLDVEEYSRVLCTANTSLYIHTYIVPCAYNPIETSRSYLLLASILFTTHSNNTLRIE